MYSSLKYSTKIRSVVIVLFILIWSSPNVRADDKNGDYVLKGVGVASCQKFEGVVASNADELPLYFGYVNGYVSAYNQIAPNTFDVLAWQRTDTLLLMLLNQCKQKPNISFGVAVSALIQYLSKESISRKVPTEVIGNTDNQMVIYRPVLERVIERLESEGYDATKPYDALMDYKADQEIADTKNVHQMILLRLMSAENG